MVRLEPKVVWIGQFVFISVNMNAAPQTTESWNKNFFAPVFTETINFFLLLCLCKSTKDYRIHLPYSFQLSVTILEASGLPAMDRNGMSDPYVKVSLQPETRQKFETHIKSNTLNPIFNETFLFAVSDSVNEEGRHVVCNKWNRWFRKRFKKLETNLLRKKKT